MNDPALSVLRKHLLIGQRQKPPNFSAFHWSPHGSLVSIGQNFVTTKVVHLPKRTETSLITESDQSGPNHQLLQLCTARTAWSDSDQAVRTVHSCISWFLWYLYFRRLYLSLRNTEWSYAGERLQTKGQWGISTICNGELQRRLQSKSFYEMDRMCCWRVGHGTRTIWP